MSKGKPWSPERGRGLLLDARGRLGRPSSAVFGPSARARRLAHRSPATVKSEPRGLIVYWIKEPRAEGGERPLPSLMAGTRTGVTPDGEGDSIARCESGRSMDHGYAARLPRASRGDPAAIRPSPARHGYPAAGYGQAQAVHPPRLARRASEQGPGHDTPLLDLRSLGCCARSRSLYDTSCGTCMVGERRAVRAVLRARVRDGPGHAVGIPYLMMTVVVCVVPSLTLTRRLHVPRARLPVARL